MAHFGALLVLVVSLFVLSITVYAQTPPSSLNDALADLSSRAGQTLTLDDLTSWTWLRRTYPDSSLGCPQAGQTYEPVTTEGYQFIFVYNGVTFDYRAPVAGGNVFLCSGPATVPQAPARPTNTPVPATTTTTSGRAVCDGAMNTRLAVGAQARVVPDGLPNNIRREASTTSERIGRIPAGEPFSVIGGPQCAQNLVWWEITYGDITGWTAEGQNGVYWIEPLSTLAPAVTPAGGTAATPVATLEPPQVFTAAAAGQALSVTNAGLLARLAELPVSERVTGLAWSADGTTLAVTVPTGIWLYNAQVFTQPPRLLRVSNATVNGITASPTANLFATAHADGTVRIWDISTGGQRAVLRSHSQPVYAVAFSPDGTRLASGGGSVETGEDSAIRLWDVTSGSQTAELQGHSAPVTALVFSPDGTRLASASLDDSVRLWDVISATPGSVLSIHTQPVRAVAFSPDGAVLASAGDDTNVIVWDTANATQTVLEGHTAPVHTLVFSPDGSVLVSAGGAENGTNDNSLRFWNLATGEQLPPLDSYGGPPEAVIQVMALSPDGTTLAFATFEQVKSTIRLWGPASQ
jgi:Tol biopolymer transport system component